MKNKFFLIILLPFFLLITTVVNSKITYVEKQVTGIGENYKMALRDAIREAISQVNGVTQETDSLIKTIEKTMNKKALKNMMPMQMGDVLTTWANIEEMKKDYKYLPKTDLEIGILKFVKWFENYYNEKK